MNRIALSVSICLSLYGSSWAKEPSLFAEAVINKDLIVVTFPDKGIRYYIELNDKQIGISNYGQNLFIKKTDKLRLTEKHFSYLITCALKDEKDNLKIEETGRDPKTGRNIQNEYFEDLRIEAGNVVIIDDKTNEVEIVHKKISDGLLIYTKDNKWPKDLSVNLKNFNTLEDFHIDIDGRRSFNTSYHDFSRAKLDEWHRTRILVIDIPTALMITVKNKIAITCIQVFVK